MLLLLKVSVEAKDDGALPDPQTVAGVAQDWLADGTRRDRELGWRVTRVEHIPEPPDEDPDSDGGEFGWR